MALCAAATSRSQAVLLRVLTARSHPESMLAFPIKDTGTGPKHAEPQSKEMMGWKMVGRNDIKMEEVASRRTFVFFAVLEGPRRRQRSAFRTILLWQAPQRMRHLAPW